MLALHPFVLGGDVTSNLTLVSTQKFHVTCSDIGEDDTQLESHLKVGMGWLVLDVWQEGETVGVYLWAAGPRCERCKGIGIQGLQTGRPSYSQ